MVLPVFPDLFFERFGSKGVSVGKWLQTFKNGIGLCLGKFPGSTANHAQELEQKVGILILLQEHQVMIGKKVHDLQEQLVTVQPERVLLQGIPV